MHDLKSFRIGEAFYYLENKKGSVLQLNVNYSSNKFEVIILKDRGDFESLKLQAGIAAKHMLGKKAKKNLVEKLVQLKI